MSSLAAPSPRGKDGLVLAVLFLACLPSLCFQVCHTGLVQLLWRLAILIFLAWHLAMHIVSAVSCSGQALLYGFWTIPFTVPNMDAIGDAGLAGPPERIWPGPFHNLRCIHLPQDIEASSLLQKQKTKITSTSQALLAARP